MNSFVTPTEITTHIETALAPAGFDIVRPFDIAAYNAFTLKNPKLPKFPGFGRDHALALLIGNTKSAWEPFLVDYQARYGSAAEGPENPFDKYSERTVRAALETGSVSYEVRFGHHSGEGFVSLLHASEASRFAKVSPAKLALHPTHGLWFALRAVAVFDCLPQEISPEDWTSPCERCDAPCERVVEAMMARHNNDWLACSWQERVEVRDACPVGRAARYSDEQIEYHYSRDTRVLDKPL